MNGRDVSLIARDLSRIDSLLKMADEPERKYSSEELQSEQVSKKDIISFIQEHASKSV